MAYPGPGMCSCVLVTPSGCRSRCCPGLQMRELKHREVKQIISVPLGQSQPGLASEPPPHSPSYTPGRGPRPPRGSQATVPSLSGGKFLHPIPHSQPRRRPRSSGLQQWLFPRICAAQGKYGNSPQSLQGPLLPHPKKDGQPPTPLFLSDRGVNRKS